MLVSAEMHIHAFTLVRAAMMFQSTFDVTPDASAYFQTYIIEML